MYLRHLSRRLSSESLPPALALGVEVRPLPQADGARPGTLAEAEPRVVGGSRVVDATVVPYGEVVLILPAQADLEVVVLDDELDEPVEEVSGLVFRHCNKREIST